MLKKLFFLLLIIAFSFPSYAGRKKYFAVQKKQVNIKQERRAKKLSSSNNNDIAKFNKILEWQKISQLNFDLSDPFQRWLFIIAFGSTIISTQAHSCPVNKHKNEQPLCRHNQLAKVSQQSYNGSINQVFIPSAQRDSGLFLFGCGSAAQQQHNFNQRMYEPMYSWVSSMPYGWRYNLWIPFEKFDDTIIERSSTYLCDTLKDNGIDTSSVFLRDINELEDVKYHREVFKDSTPIFLQADTVRLSIIIQEIERMKHEPDESSQIHAIYSDLDPLAVPFKQIFNAENTATLARHGFAMFHPEHSNGAPWPSFMALSAKASLPQLRKYLHKALNEIGKYHPSLNSHVQTLITIWYIEQERPELINKLSEARQKMLDSSLDYPTILMLRIGYYFQNHLSNDDFIKATATIRKYLNKGYTQEIIVEKVLETQAYNQLSPSHLSWLASSQYEIFDDLIAYQQLYNEGMIDPAEFSNFLASFPALRGIISTTPREPFAILCPSITHQ